MSKSDKEDKVNAAIRNFCSGDTSKPSLLISEKGEFLVSFYAGMGSTDTITMEKLDPLYKIMITDLYESGKIQETGESFSLYPHTIYFKKLVLVDN